VTDKQLLWLPYRRAGKVSGACSGEWLNKNRDDDDISNSGLYASGPMHLYHAINGKLCRGLRAPGMHSVNHPAAIPSAGPAKSSNIITPRM
jgi:hypothetical protein